MRRYQVIRITCLNESATTRLVVGGKLAGRCVGELERSWQLALSNQTLIVVDLTSVSYIDHMGREVSDALVQYRKVREIRTQQELLVVALPIDRAWLIYATREKLTLYSMPLMPIGICLAPS